LARLATPERPRLLSPIILFAFIFILLFMLPWLFPRLMLDNNKLLEFRPKKKRWCFNNKMSK
jgi:hypothetical protein